MSAAPKLAGFAVVLALAFGGAALAGSAVGPVRDQHEPAMAMGEMQARAVRGLYVCCFDLAIQFAKLSQGGVHF